MDFNRCFGIIINNPPLLVLKTGQATSYTTGEDDGVDDHEDNCHAIVNPNQEDTDY
jgi:hypothetical protein